jgi:hypothetical protein
LQRLYFKHLQKKNTDLPEATKMTVWSICLKYLNGNCAKHSKNK